MDQELVDALAIVIRHLEAASDLPEPVEDAVALLRDRVIEAGVEFIDDHADTETKVGLDVAGL